jgi:hypothetical protein
VLTSDTFWMTRKLWSLISFKAHCDFTSLDKEINTGSQMRPECPSCEVIEILGCLYSNLKKKEMQKTSRNLNRFFNEKFSRKVLYGSIH